MFIPNLVLCQANDTDKCKATLPQTSNEYRSSYACRGKVREVAHALRHLVETRVREEIPGAFEKITVLRKLYPIIDALEWDALSCCRKGESEGCCTQALIEQLNQWNSEGFIKYASNT